MRRQHVGVLLAAITVAACTRVPTAASDRDLNVPNQTQSNPPAVSVQGPPSLFANAARSPEIDTARDTGVVRNRYVSVNFDVLGAVRRGGAFGLNLFEDASFTAMVETAEPGGPGSTSVTGRLRDVDGSSYTLVANEGVLIGSIITPQAQYQVRYAGNGVHAVRQFDPTQLPNERPPVSPTRRPPPEH